jgi:mRNA interferase HicA
MNACSQGDMAMKQREFRRWLALRGALFKEGSKHTRVYLGGRQSTLPRHPAHEIGEALRKAIIRQLGL